MRHGALCTLLEWVRAAPPGDRMPLMTCLLECVLQLMEGATEVPATVGNDKQWASLSAKLASCASHCQQALEWFSLNPELEGQPAAEFSAWLPTLRARPGAPPACRPRYLASLEDTAVHPRDGTLLPPGKFCYHRTKYKPPGTVLDALRDLKDVPFEPHCQLCLTCDAVTRDIAGHTVRAHGAAPVASRHATMADVIRKAIDFDSQYACRGLEDHVPLTSNDVQAVYVYTLDTDLSSWLRRCLRDPHLDGIGKLRPLIYFLQAALGRLPPYSGHGAVYRVAARKALPCEEGSLLQWDAFSSATADVQVVADALQPRCSLLVLRLRGAATTARLVSFLSALPGEAEVLLDADTWAEVRRKYGHAEKWLLAHRLKVPLDDVDVYEVEEVDPGAVRRAQWEAAGVLAGGIDAAFASARDHTAQLLTHLQEGNEVACRMDLNDGANPNAVVPDAGSDGGCPLVVAAVQHDMPTLCTALLEARADVRAMDNTGTSLMALAALRQWHAVCARLEALGVADAVVGTEQHIGADGAELIAQLCPRLRALSIGDQNHIAEAGLLAIARHCELLTALTVGAGQGVGALAVTALADHCRELRAVHLGDNNGVGQAVAVLAERGRQLTSLGIGANNAVGEQGARAIAKHCRHLTTLLIGDANHILSSGVRAIAEQCRCLTSLHIGATNDMRADGARAVARHCAALTALHVGAGNDIGHAGALAIAESCPQLQRLHVEYGNALLESASEEITRLAPQLKALHLDLVRAPSCSPRFSDRQHSISFSGFKLPQIPLAGERHFSTPLVSRTPRGEPPSQQQHQQCPSSLSARRHRPVGSIHLDVPDRPSLPTQRLVKLPPPYSL